VKTFPNKETQFKPGQSGNPAGRKKSQLSNLEKMAGQEYGLKLTKHDIALIMQWIIERTFTELKEIKENPNTPVFINALISAMEKDLKKGSIKTLEMIFDRIYGKPGPDKRETSNSGKSLEWFVTYGDEKEKKELE